MWKHYESYLNKLTEKTHKPQEHLLTLNVKNKNNNTKKTHSHNITNNAI